jgi:hypothetical protein
MLLTGTNIYLLAAAMVAVAPRERPKAVEPKTVRGKGRLRLVEANAAPAAVAEDDKPHPAQRADVSAKAFASWLRSYGPAKYDHAGIVETYQEWCANANRLPSAVNMVLAELAKCKGIRRAVEDKVIGGRRTRPVAWFVEPLRAEPKPTMKKKKVA